MQQWGGVGAARGECFFYATHGGAELDLLVARGGMQQIKGDRPL